MDYKKEIVKMLLAMEKTEDHFLQIYWLHLSISGSLNWIISGFDPFKLSPEGYRVLVQNGLIFEFLLSFGYSPIEPGFGKPRPPSQNTLL
jgi:hypothetical protein